jgi:hypothetical protein
VSTGPETLEAKLAALRARFIAERLPLLVDTLDGQARSSAAAGWPAEPTREARRSAHSLKGITGTHGLTAVSLAADVVDAILTAAGRDAPDPALAPRLEAALVALRAAATAAVATD